MSTQVIVRTDYSTREYRSIGRLPRGGREHFPVNFSSQKTGEDDKGEKSL